MEFQILKAKSSGFTMKLKKNDSIITFHSRYNPEEEARNIIKQVNYEPDTLLIILGLGLGYHIEAIREKFSNIKKLIVIEKSQDIHDLAERYGCIKELSHNDILLNLPADQVLSHITQIHIKLGMPPVSIFMHKPSVQAFPEYYYPIYKRLKSMERFRIWDRLRYKKFQNEQIKILLIDFDYFIYREIKKAITTSGHKLISFHVKNKKLNDIIGGITRLVLQYKPDLILTVNHFGFDEEGYLISFLESIEMPVASWFVDNPHIIVSPYHKNISPITTIFVWDSYYIQKLMADGFEYVEYLPLATDTQVFRPLSVNKTIFTGFVGNSWNDKIKEVLSCLPDDLKEIAHRLALILYKQRQPFEHILKHLDYSNHQYINSLSRANRINFESAVYWLATSKYRLACLKQLKEFEPVIHGDTYWKDIANDFAIVKPPLNYYKDLPYFYNRCRINMNMTSLQMVNGVNQRVFDIPACKSFIITDAQGDLENLFNIGHDIVIYNDIEELPEIIKYYKDHPEKAESIAERGRIRVMKEHTYIHRINKIINIMSNRYGLSCRMGRRHEKTQDTYVQLS